MHPGERIAQLAVMPVLLPALERADALTVAIAALRR